MNRQRQILPVSRLRAQRRKRTLLISGGIALGVLLICAGSIWLAWRPFWRISSVEVAGNQTISTSTIAAFARRELDGTYLFIIPRDNIFLYPKERIESGLRAAQPSLSSVAVHAANFSSISISVSEYQPKAVWCVAKGGTCFLLNEDGLAYAPAPVFSESPYVQYFGTLAGEKLPKQFLTAPEFRVLSALTDAFAQKVGPVKDVTVDEHKDVQVDFRNTFVMRFALGDDAGKVLERFTVALQNPPFTSRELTDFEYLDLRFGDKLYYKLK